MGFMSKRPRWVPYAKWPRWLYIARAGAELTKVGWSTNPDQRVKNCHYVHKNGRLEPMLTPEKPTLVWRHRYHDKSVVAVETALKHLLQKFALGAEWYCLPATRAIEAAEFVVTHMRRPTLQAAQRFVAQHEPWSKLGELK